VKLVTTAVDSRLQAISRADESNADFCTYSTGNKERNITLRVIRVINTSAE
jgi:deoxyribose-phosphate aldolase